MNKQKIHNSTMSRFPSFLKRRTALRRWVVVGVLVGFAAGAVGTVNAVAQGFTASGTIPPGSLVSLDTSKDGTVTAATAENASGLAGVVVSPQDTLLSVVSGQNQVQVASSDTASVLVSTLNGDVAAGDHVAPSLIAGVGAKAVASGKVLGIAQASFNAKTDGAAKRTVKLADGTSKDVYVGQIPIQIQIADYVQPEANRAVPKFIQDLSNAVAGKQVSTGRIIVGGIIIFVALITITVLLYGATRSSIISIGRNPLSRAAVERSLFQVIFVVAVITIAAGAGVYLIFRGS